jgi:hypothetical protein
VRAEADFLATRRIAYAIAAEAVAGVVTKTTIPGAGDAAISAFRRAHTIAARIWRTGWLFAESAVHDTPITPLAGGITDTVTAFTAVRRHTSAVFIVGTRGVTDTIAANTRIARRIAGHFLTGTRAEVDHLAGVPQDVLQMTFRAKLTEIEDDQPRSPDSVRDITVPLNRRHTIPHIGKDIRHVGQMQRQDARVANIEKASLPGDVGHEHDLPVV